MIEPQSNDFSTVIDLKQQNPRDNAPLRVLFCQGKRNKIFKRKLGFQLGEPEVHTRLLKLCCDLSCIA